MKRKYPWDDWFSRSSFVVKLSDYTCRVSAMVQQIRDEAGRRGVRVKVEEEIGGTIRVKIKGVTDA